MRMRTPTIHCMLLIGIAAITAGCGTNWKAEIDSNTSWYMLYGGASGNTFASSELSGSGSRTVDMPDDDRVCLVLQQNGSGYVNVTLRDTGGGLFHILAEDERTVSTNVNGGIVDMCSEGSLPPNVSRREGAAARFKAAPVPKDAR